MTAAPRTSTALTARPPTVMPTVLRRRRLETTLDRATASALTLISAGPGFGKTIAVASWAELRRFDRAVGWLGLVGADNTSHAFWSGVLTAIRASGAVPADNGLNDIIPGGQFRAAEVDTLLSGLTDLPRPIVLVIDDFHLITSQEVLASFANLLERIPARLRIVLTTRADPILPLHRLRVAGQLTEIRSRDLAFTEQEAAELFALEGFDLAPEQVATLFERTQGWPAGLRLAAMSLDRTDVDAGIARVTGSDRVIAEYLIGEVTERLDTADREFLLRTSVVDRLCGDLADRLTGRGDGQQTLEKLLRTNAFVSSLDEEGRWFSYHPLLRELLRHRLALQDRAAVPEMNRRVAAWLADRGDPIESLRYSIKAGDWDVAGRTLIGCVHRILSVQAPALASAIEPMARRANDHPGLYELIAAAALHLQRLDYVQMERDVVDARQFLDSAPEDLRPTVSVLLDLFDLAVARRTGDAAQSVDIGRRVLDTLDRSSRRVIPLARYFRAIATNNLAVGLLWTDDMDAAERMLNEAERQLGDLGLELALLNATAFQALLDAMVGRSRRAERRARQGLELVDRRGWGSAAQGMALHLALGMMLVARGSADQASRTFARGLALGGPQTDRSVRLGLAIGAVEAAVLRGDPTAALDADAQVRSGISRTPATPIRLRRWAAVAGAQALLAAGRPAEAIDRLGDPAPDRGFSAAWQRVWLARACVETGSWHRAEELLRPFTEPGWRYREAVVYGRLLMSVVADKQHRDGAALAHFTAAVDLAAPEGIRRPFLQLAGRIAGTMRRYRLLNGTHDDFVAGLTVDAPDEAVGAAAQPIERLTERELIVLQYLPTMLKAGEIADDLFVSVNTVKAHLRSMYRKLGAGNRREAVERARVQGLL